MAGVQYAVENGFNLTKTQIEVFSISQILTWVVISCKLSSNEFKDKYFANLTLTWNFLQTEHLLEQVW